MASSVWMYGVVSNMSSTSRIDFNTDLSDVGTVATIFTDSNYGGDWQHLRPGSYNRLADAVVVGAVAVDDNTLSSLRVAAGFRFTRYQDPSFAGQQWTFTADTPYVGDDANDQASSIVVTRI
ncbi:MULTISPECIES: hypothetical protein [unclassified Streptomyces]|uniref:hypothetical protein n=1 Tax=unclassified Streptomyces TaxID=2593676 RepID=UPI000940233B|nr:hypothetical protein [Streptomyces sp. TSRI0281]OKI41286.1 hypothetical protein A6A29_38125 [Streptomyces sp. TSRI0281]